MRRLPTGVGPHCHIVAITMQLPGRALRTSRSTIALAGSAVAIRLTARCRRYSCVVKRGMAFGSRTAAFARMGNGVFGSRRDARSSAMDSMALWAREPTLGCREFATVMTCSIASTDLEPVGMHSFCPQ